MSVPRRTLVKGAGWATPIVLASTAIPAYAASTCNVTAQYTARIVEVGGEYAEGGATIDISVSGSTLSNMTVTSPADGPIFEASDVWAVSSDGKVATYIGAPISDGSIAPLQLQLLPNDPNLDTLINRLIYGRYSQELVYSTGGLCQGDVLRTVGDVVEISY